MKKMRKLLVLLLTLSLALCATAVIAFAEGEENAVTDAEIESLLELYKSGIYYAEDYEDSASISSDSDIDDKSGIVEKITADDGNSLIKIVGREAANDVSITAQFDGELAGFVYQTDISADGGVLNVYVSGTDGNETFENIPLVSINFEEGAVYVQVSGAYGMPVMQKLDGVSIKEETLYNISVVYDASAASYALSVEEKSDAEAALSYSASFGAVVNTLSGAKASIAGATIAGKTIYLDNIYFYEGTELKDLASAEAGVGAVINRLVEKLEAAEDTEKAALVDALNVIIQKRGFKADAYTDIIKYAKLLIAENYIDDYVNLVYSYNFGDLYSEKVARAEEIEAIRDIIPEIPEYDAAETGKYEKMLAVKSERLKADTEYLMITIALDRLTSESEEFVRFMYDKDSRNNRYSDVKSWIDTAGLFGFDPTFDLPVEVTVSETVNGEETERTEIHYMNVSLEKYLHLITKEQLIKADSIAYINYVKAMTDMKALEDGESVYVNPFNVRYEAYVNASAIRFLDAENTFSYVVKSLNEEGEEIEETVYLKDYVEKYNAEYKSIIDVEKICRNFIAAVTDAKNAIDINNLNIALAKAEKYDMAGNDEEKIKIEFSYPGVEEAVADYNALCLKRETEQKQADDFIAAVELIKAASDNAGLKAAIATARAILPHGILTGYAGYSEALSYFSSVEASLLYNESYANRFIEIVNSLNDIPMGKERYDAIAEANDCYAHIVGEVDGVAAAKAVLTAAIQVYDASAAVENESFDKEVGKSVKIASAANPSDAFLKLVAIVKKIFE